MVLESKTKEKTLTTYNPFLFSKATEMEIETTILRDGKLLKRVKNQNQNQNQINKTKQRN